MKNIQDSSKKNIDAESIFENLKTTANLITARLAQVSQATPLMAHNISISDSEEEGKNEKKEK